MTWWHSDLETWAGTDGTDIHKAITDVANGIRERFVMFDIKQTGSWDGIPDYHEPLLYVNTNRSPIAPFDIVRKTGPFEYDDMLGLPLHGELWQNALTVRTALFRLLYQGPTALPYSPLAARWAKSPDYDGESWDGVYTLLDFVSVDNDTVIPYAGGWGQTWYGIPTPPYYAHIAAYSYVNIFMIKDMLMWMRQVLELLIYPIFLYTIENGMTVEDHYKPCAWPSSACNADYPVYPSPMPIGYEWDPNYMYRYSKIEGQGWKGVKRGPYTYDACPAYLGNTVTPHDALSRMQPYPQQESQRPSSIYKRVMGGSIRAKRWRVIFIPPGFRSPPAYSDRGPVVIEGFHTFSADIRELAVYKIKPYANYSGGKILREMVKFNVGATNCPVISWKFGDNELSVTEFELPVGVLGGRYAQWFFEVDGILDPTKETTHELRHKEASSDNPFDGVVSNSVTFQPTDTVYRYTYSHTTTGVGDKTIGMSITSPNTINYQAFSLMDGEFIYK